MPKAYLKIKLLSNQITSRYKNYLLSVLYVKSIQAILSKQKHLLQFAGVNLDFELDDAGIVITLGGYSDRILELTYDLIHRLKKLNIDATSFNEIKLGFKKSIENLPYGYTFMHAVYESKPLTFKNFIHNHKLLNLIEEVTLQEVQAFIPQLFAETYFRCLTYGNLDPSKVKNLLNQIPILLGASPITDSIKQEKTVYRFPQGKPMAHSVRSPTRNNVWYQRVQFGERTYLLDAIVRMGNIHLKSGFYHELRTVQELGYAVMSNTSYKPKVLSMFFYIQSSGYSAAEVARRGLSWVRSEIDKIESIPDVLFDRYKNSLVVNLRQTPKNMKDKFKKYWENAFWKNGNFNYNQQVISKLNGVTKKQVAEVFQRAFSPSTQSSLSVYLHAQGQPFEQLSEETLIRDIDLYKNQTPTY